VLELEEWVERIPVSLCGSFDQEHQLRYLIEKHQGHLLDTHYGTKVTLHTQLPQVTLQAFLADLQVMGITRLVDAY
jgi:predicted transcriptional regulator